MKINKKYILAITLLGCSSSGLAKGPAADFSISWTGETTNDVSVIKEEGQNVGKNHNEMLSHQDWGVANRNNDDKGPVETYEESDPDLMIHGPGGEEYGVETEYGFDPIYDFDIAYEGEKFEPRSPGTKTVKHYMDCGQTGLLDILYNGVGKPYVDRSEIHIRSTLEEIGAEEHKSLWLGWSEYYSYLDKSRATTIMQFRNQPSSAILESRGFDVSAGSEYLDYIGGGPATGITLQPGGDGELHYYFESRQGTPTPATGGWEVLDDRKKMLEQPVKTGVWYDFVVQIIYKQYQDPASSEGRFRVWVYDTSDVDNNSKFYSVKDVPQFDISGSTMYTYPSAGDVDNYVTAPQLRWGLYRHNCKYSPEINDSNRYMTKYLGPVKMWVGDSANGFKIVKPGNN